MPDSLIQQRNAGGAPAERSKRTSLSRREVECVSRLAHGYRSEAIAYELGVKRVTVDLHISNAKRKLSASTREHAVALAIAQGIIQFDG